MLSIAEFLCEPVCLSDTAVADPQRLAAQVTASATLPFDP